MSNTSPPGRLWVEKLAPYARPDLKRSLFQLANSALLFAGLWTLMLLSLKVSYWLTLALAIPTAGMSIRLFIIQHDCGHGSFFRSRRANDAVGFVLGVVTFTPYGYWRKTHAIHHATSGNLDERLLGDVTTLTVREYLGLPLRRRWAYRAYRHPLVLFVVGPFYQFLLKHRLPFDLPLSWKREWASVLRTNLALVAVGVLAWATIGLKALLLVQLPITMISGIAGIWLFYIQHQYEDAYWKRNEDWDFHDAGFEGSSFYDLPRIMHWFTGNIGVHHVHHMSSRIPNYRLLECHRAHPEFERVKRLTFWKSLHCARLKLWDEKAGRLVSFRGLRTAS